MELSSENSRRLKIINYFDKKPSIRDVWHDSNYISEQNFQKRKHFRDLCETFLKSLILFCLHKVPYSKNSKKNPTFQWARTFLGIDDQLAKHVAHLFIRDPLAVYAEQLNIGDENETDHFENINSTNWQTVRFKPPPPGSKIGWRVEMRPVEVRHHFMSSTKNVCCICKIALFRSTVIKKSRFFNFFCWKPINGVTFYICNQIMCHIWCKLITKKLERRHWYLF